jgi:hypothetical protein
MPAGDFFVEVGDPGTATTLSAPGYTAGGTSINVGSTTNWPSVGKAVVFAIDEVETVDGVEQQVAGTYNEFEGTVASGTSISNVDWKRGSGDRNYSAGSTTRVYISVSAERENRLVEGISEEHNQDGTHENVTASSLSVSGTTTLAGALTLRSYDGWIYPTYTPTFATSTSITVAGVDVTSQFPVGTKVVMNQSGLKYFYVTSRSFSTNTTINLTGGSDFTVANAAISGFGYSYDVTPQGFPQWFNHSVTVTNLTKGNGTDSCRFKMIGNTVFFRIRFVFGSTSSITGGLTATLPIAANSGWSSSSSFLGHMLFQDAGAGEYNGTAESTSTTGAILYKDNVSGTNIIKSALSSTVPFTWGTTDEISGLLIYQA